MEIYRLGRTDPADIDALLFCEQNKRGIAHDREKKKDMLYIYKPTEAFSITHERDLKSIRYATRAQFYAYTKAHNIPTITTHRGGGMIWLGPGQIALAPLVDVKRRQIDLLDYSALMEETCIETIAAFGIKSVRNHYRYGAQGAWMESGEELKKIAFFGLKAARGIMIHGCIVNVEPDLYPFSLIDPCNLPGISVTSLKEVLGETPPLFEVEDILIATFLKLLERASKTKK